MFALVLTGLSISSYSQYNMDELKNIHGLNVYGDIDMIVKFGDKHALEIKSNDLDSGCFIHEIENGILTLKIKTNINCNGEVKAILHIPTLSDIKLTGKAVISSEGMLKTDTLKVYQQLGSKSYLDLNVKVLDAQLMEGSMLEAKGYADSMVVSVNSKAMFDAINLETESADVTAKLVGTAKICVNKNLKAYSGTNGYILYRCDPEQTDFEKKLGGKIEASTD